MQPNQKTVHSYRGKRTSATRAIGYTHAAHRNTGIANEFATAIVFGVLAATFAFANSFFGSPILPKESTPWVGLLMILLASYGFWNRGGNALTPLSVVFLAFLLNLAFPVFYTSLASRTTDYQAATAQGLLLSLVCLFTFRKDRGPTTDRAWKFNLNVAITLFGFIVTYGVFVGLVFAVPSLGAIWTPTIGMFPSIFTAFACIALHRRNAVILIVSSIATLGALVLYYEFAFQHSGRLNVAALLVSTAIMASWMWPTRWYKVSILAFAPVAIAWAGFHRALRETSSFGWSSGTTVVETGAGMGSLLAPFLTLSEIVRRSDFSGIKHGLEWFDQVVFSLFFYVPRAVWPSKPEGFGRVMVYELSPQLLNTGHSMAASIFGEYVYYFGFFGFAFGIVACSAAVRSANAILNRLSRSESGILILLLGMTAYMLGQYLTLVWGGLAVFVVRGLAPPLGMSLILVAWRISSAAKSSGV